MKIAIDSRGSKASFLTLLLSFSVLLAVSAQGNALRALDGTWLFVEDRTEGRAIEDGGAPMNVKFSLRVESDAVIYPRSRGDERIPLDGSIIEKNEEDGSLKRYRGEWKEKDQWLEYTIETLRQDNHELLYVIKRVFRVTEEGLLVYVFSNKFAKQIALYCHPKDIPLADPFKATISDLAWLAGNWQQIQPSSSLEERWSPPKGGAMIGVSRTVKREQMTGFEYLRIVEREGGLIYIAQPGGRSPTEFVLTKLDKQRAEFVNPRHDYPQRIVYELSEEKTLIASIGFAIGRLKGTEFAREP